MAERWGSWMVPSRKETRWCRGQSLTEYLMVISAIILAAIAAQGLLRDRMNNLGNESSNQMNSATGQLNSMNTFGK